MRPGAWLARASSPSSPTTPWGRAPRGSSATRCSCSTPISPRAPPAENRSVRVVVQAQVQPAGTHRGGAMNGFRRTRSALFVLAALTALALPAVAAGDHGSGGGGGTPPAPTTAPAVTFTPTSLTFAARAIGTTSAPQSISVANTGNAPL